MPAANSHGKIVRASQGCCLVVCLVASLGTCQLGRAAKVSWEDRFVFQDTAPRVNGYEGYAVQAWALREKQRVRQAIRTAKLLAPGVVERVTAYRPVNLYRSRDPQIRGALAIASPIRNGLYVTNRLLNTRKSKSVEDTLIHEWTHLIDAAYMLENNSRWTSVILPRIQRVQQSVRTRGSRYFDVNFQQLSPSYMLLQDRKHRQLAVNEGLPALYACTNLAESLAVCVERRVKGYRPEPAMDAFLQQHFLSTPYRTDAGMRHVHEAMAFHVSGERDKAIEAYTRLIDASTRFQTLTRYRASVLGDARRWDEAIDDLTTALDVFRGAPKATADIFKQRARCHMLHRQYDQAIADITRVIEMGGSGRSENYVARADVWQRMGKIEEAILDLNHAIDVYPTMQRAYQQRAYLWRRQGEPQREEADWTKLIELDADNLHARRQRANLRNRDKRIDDAIADWSEILFKQPKDNSALVSRARAYESLDQYRQAADDYRQLKSHHPNSLFRYSTDQARCLVQLGQYRAALQALDAAIQQRESYYVPYQEKAWLLATCKEPSIRDGELARQLAEKACELTKERQFRCLESLAAAHAELGDFQQAIQWQSKALELARSDSDRQTLQQRVAMYEAEQKVYEAE